MKLDNGQIIISNVEQTHLACPNDEIKVEKGCKLCLMKVSCLCSIHAGSFFFPPRFQNCQNGSSISKVYPVNLALLQEIYEPET